MWRSIEMFESYCKVPHLGGKFSQSSAFECPGVNVRAITAPLTLTITREVALIIGVCVSEYRALPKFGCGSQLIHRDEMSERYFVLISPKKAGEKKKFPPSPPPTGITERWP